MITASHNPEEVSWSSKCRSHSAIYILQFQDNGVKLVEPMGEMLPTSWESSATNLANSPTEDELIKSLDSIISEFKIDLSFRPSVVYAHDTRPSCPQLVKSLEDGMKCFDTETIFAGLKTTPQLHYLVRCINTKGQPNTYGEPSEEGYYKKLSSAFLELIVSHVQNPAILTVCPLERKNASIPTHGRLRERCRSSSSRSADSIPETFLNQCHQRRHLYSRRFE
jgi:hypothetical protein